MKKKTIGNLKEGEYMFKIVATFAPVVERWIALFTG